VKVKTYGNREHRAPFGVSVITHTKTHGRTPLDKCIDNLKKTIKSAVSTTGGNFDVFKIGRAA
jgi:hypothetical protein